MHMHEHKQKYYIMNI